MANNFLELTGTNGYLTTLTVISTESNGLLTTNTCVSSVNGGSSNGVFSQTDTQSGIFGQVWFKSGGTFTPSVGGSLSGWFVLSDGSGTFELTLGNTAMPRAPDFVIPLYNSAYSVGNYAFASGLVKLPFPLFKVLLQNNAGVTLPATGNIIGLGSVAILY